MPHTTTNSSKKTKSWFCKNLRRQLQLAVRPAVDNYLIASLLKQNLITPHSLIMAGGAGGVGVSSSGNNAVLHERRTIVLMNAMRKMDVATVDALRCCDMLTKRARQLDSLTSPASDASSMLSRANASLAATVVLMKDAREKFDTVTDCEPAIERLHKGVRDMEEIRTAGKGGKINLRNRVILTEQDIYAAGDSLEILRDAFDYFSQRNSWRSSPTTLGELERVYKQGLDGLGMLIASHLKKAGQAVRPKRHVKKQDMPLVPPTDETAQQVGYKKQGLIFRNQLCLFILLKFLIHFVNFDIQTRARLASALQNRNLLKSIGEFEEYQPVEARQIREIRSIFDCLGSHGYNLGPMPKREPAGLLAIFGVPANKVCIV